MTEDLKPERHEGFSMECPGCKRYLDIPEDTFAIPPHPREEPVRTYPIGDDRPAYPIGGHFPAMTIGVVEVSKLCKYSGAQLRPRLSSRG